MKAKTKEKVQLMFWQKTEDGRLIDVEIQIADHHGMIKRSVYYASKMIAKQIHKDGDKKIDI